MWHLYSYPKPKSASVWLHTKWIFLVITICSQEFWRFIWSKTQPKFSTTNTPSSCWRQVSLTLSNSLISTLTPFLTKNTGGYFSSPYCSLYIFFNITLSWEGLFSSFPLSFLQQHVSQFYPLGSDRCTTFPLRTQDEERVDAQTQVRLSRGPFPAATELSGTVSNPRFSDFQLGLPTGIRRL